MRISVRFLRPWRMISWQAACGIRWVKPSSAIVSPSRTASLMASARDEIRAIKTASRLRQRIYGPPRTGSNGCRAKKDGTPTMDIKGEAAIVTGGASGLGAATARALAAAGAKVAVFDLNEKGAAEVATDINGIAVACDVANAQGAKAAIDTAATVHGAARILINCAGVGPAKRIVGRDGPMPLEDYEKVIRVNLIGTFNMMRLVAAAMQPLEPFADGERGVIVPTASVAAFEGQIGQA